MELGIKLAVVLLQFSVFYIVTIQTRPQIGTYYNVKTVNKCFSVAGVPKLNFECAPGEMILIREAFQGVGQGCSYTDGDCTEPATSETNNKLNEFCIGKSSCEITVGVTWMPQCGAYSNYNYVIYQCIPRMDLLDVCMSETVSVSRIAFLVSPGYPAKYTPHKECQCNITTEIDQKILVKFFDFSIEWSEGCQKDVLRVTDGVARMPRCGKLPRNYNITSRTSRLDVFFKTDGWEHQKGFWLQAEALGRMHIACGPTDNSLMTSTTTPPPTTTTITTPDTTMESELNEMKDTKSEDDGFREAELGFNNMFYPNSGMSPSQKSEQNSAADNGLEYNDLSSGPTESNSISPIVGIIIGCVLLVSLILISIFLFLWFKRHRHKEEINRVPHGSYLSKLHRRHQNADSDRASPMPSTPGHNDIDKGLSDKKDKTPRSGKKEKRHKSKPAGH